MLTHSPVWSLTPTLPVFFFMKTFAPPLWYSSSLSVTFQIPLPAHISTSPPPSLFFFFALLSLICLSLLLSFFLQPTTAASRSCRPSLMCEPLNCHPSATRSSIRVSLASIWPEDQSTGPAGLTEAGPGSPLSAQVSTWLHIHPHRKVSCPIFALHLVPTLVWLIWIKWLVCKWGIKVMLIYLLLLFMRTRQARVGSPSRSYRLYNINKVWKPWLDHCIPLIRFAEVPLLNGAGVSGAEQTNGVPLRHLPQTLA